MTLSQGKPSCPLQGFLMPCVRKLRTELGAPRWGYRNKIQQMHTIKYN